MNNLSQINYLTKSIRASTNKYKEYPMDERNGEFTKSTAKSLRRIMVKNVNKIKNIILSFI